MIDYTNTDIKKTSVHSVGNKTNGEELFLSKSLLDISDLRVRELLFKFFLTPFASPEFHSFTFSNEDFTLNPLFNFTSQIFDSSKTFQKNSVNIAKHLYELSVHPQIKSGDLFITYFTDISIEDELTDAIGVFKSENRQAFLKLNNNQEDFSIQYDDGINIEKLDKGCLIFNTNKKNGYKVCIIDKSNKSTEAQYWKDDFLQIKPLNDNYHFTNHFLKLTKQFITTTLVNEYEISKTDQVDLLNKSVNYFKENETFDIKDFQKTVFEDKEITKSFRSFGSAYSERNDIDIADRFEISDQAVKKQAKAFKSVLKLDKNFHIYIHGDKELIEKGFDKQKNMNYYKVYFREEQ